MASRTDSRTKIVKVYGPFLNARTKAPANNTVPRRITVPGSGTDDAGWAMIKALSTPATRNDPEDGDRVTEIAGPAINASPFDSIKVVGLKVAIKLADVKLIVSGNCSTGGGLPSESSNGPGPMFPKGIT